HHSGSKTFKIVNVDYERLMEENRKRFIEKWQGLIQGSGSKQPGSTRTSPTVFILPSGEQATTSVENIEAFASDMDVVHVDGTNLADVISSHLNDASDIVFFVSGGTSLTPDWARPLQAALASDSIGCVLSATNAGWGGQRIEPGYKRTGKPLLRFARKHALEFQGRLVDVDPGYPVALAIRKETLLDCGLASNFSTSALLIDLQRRLRDRGLRVVCAMDSYVHSQPHQHHSEVQAVMNFLDGRRAVEEGDLDRALSHFDQALKIMPGYAEVLYEKGVVLAIKGQKPEATEVFERMTGIVPSDSRVWNNLGCLYFEGGEVERARVAFERAIKADSNNWEAKKNLADLYLSLGRSDEAGDIYASIISEHAGTPEVYVAVAETFAQSGDPETAARLCEMALRVNPGDEKAKRVLEALKLCVQKAGT
ncbi:MAG TPA: tetratricopeptide repeat protein, partial [Firmicutes bacterium]|nr:tetratricopeptide repeat protein [Bacillota bacterium]